MYLQYSIVPKDVRVRLKAYDRVLPEGVGAPVEGIHKAVRRVEHNLLAHRFAGEADCRASSASVHERLIFLCDPNG